MSSFTCHAHVYIQSTPNDADWTQFYPRVELAIRRDVLQWAVGMLQQRRHMLFVLKAGVAT